TLAALLPALDRLIVESDRASASVWGVGSHLRVIYVAPLKALVNDVARNLTTWIEQIGHFPALTAPLPRVAIRHGDTSAEERRALLEDPPEVLLTTPESLAVLLSQPDVVSLFRTVRLAVV